MDHSFGFFRTKLVADQLWLISGCANEQMYLVVGGTRAMLVDTGMGIGDLAEVVHTLTHLPVFVVNTHGHPDHAGGNPLFKEVWLHPRDRSILRRMCTDRYRSADIKAAMGEDRSEYTRVIDGMVHYQPVRVHPVKAGQVFDLGGRRFEVLWTPGHTPGSICLLNAREKILFTGDTIVETPVWLYLEHSLPVKTFRDSLDGLWARRSEFNVLFPGHPPAPLAREHLSDLLACSGEILDQAGIGERTITFAGEGIQWSHGKVSIIYDLDKVR